MESNQKTVEIVKEVLEKLGVQHDQIEVVDTPAHPLLTIQSPDSGILIGRDGENLRALNHIVKKLVHQTLGDDAGAFLLDVNGYHQKRIDDLTKRSRLVAERVRLFKTAVEMEPMNAYERMIVHSLFSDDEEIETASQGEGRFRHVVVHYKSAAPTAELNL